jgi:type II secretory pathway component PulF
VRQEPVEQIDTRNAIVTSEGDVHEEQGATQPAGATVSTTSLIEAAPAPTGRPRVRRSQRLKLMAVWTRQLFVLVRSGTPVAEAMRAVEQQVAAGGWRDVLSNLRRQIDDGTSLSVAMDRFPTIFDSVCRSLVAAGESTGKLDIMLERLSILTRQQLRVRRSLIGALVYPAMLVVVAVSVMTTMICFVLPRFAELFGTLDVPLPPTTNLLIGVSEALRSYWWLALLAIFAVIAGAYALMSTPGGRRVFDGWCVKMPVLGKIVRNFAAAKIARLLGTLTESRVPLLDALELTREASGSMVYYDLMLETEERVSRGESISASFRGSPLISPSMTEAIYHGEQNGQVGTVLCDLADFMDEENETVVRTLTSILEPIILIVLGAVVALVALSMFLPLFDLTSMT